MEIATRLQDILDAALGGRGADHEDCTYLLSLAPDSLDAALLAAVADTVSRRRFGNQAILLGQIGIDTAPCPGECKFCALGKGHTRFEESRLPIEEVLSRARSFTAGGDLFALFLMTTHEFDLAYLLSVVRAVREAIPAQTQIVANVGDFGPFEARALKSAGVDGAYHVRRLREGVDSALDPRKREETMGVIREAGLDFYFCCEPIGPEHSPEETADQLFVGIKYGCFQHAAMRRVYVQGTPLSAKGQITERRLAQVVAVVTLAALSCPETTNIAVHEPNLLGLAAGANAVYAETGSNPRDTEADTSTNRGLDVAACRKMLYEAGFSELRRGDGTSVSLDLNYLQGANT